MSEDLRFALDRLVDESQPLRAVNLAALSDVPRSQTRLFVAAWEKMSAERRYACVRELVEQAEANIHMNFTAILRECLTDPVASVRALAVEGLWEDNRPVLIGPLVRLLSQDPAPQVRAAAAVSLARFVLMGVLGEVAEASAAEAVDALRQAWYRPQELTEVRRRAMEGLAYISSAEVRSLIDSAYYDEDELMRQSAIFAMGRSADARWARHVLPELESHSTAMRFEAAVAAGELALKSALRPLIQLLDDPDGNVREAAVLALGKIGGPEARRVLESCAAGDDERIAEAAGEALQELSFNSEELDPSLLEFDGVAVEDEWVEQTEYELDELDEDNGVDGDFDGFYEHLLEESALEDDNWDDWDD